MKRIILFLLLCCSAPLFGQHGRVLIATRDSSGFLVGIKKLDSALRKSYDGNIVTYVGLLPDSLETYDAIFTDLRFFDNDDSILIANELKKLSSYLLSIGKLYLEVTHSTTFYKHWDFDHRAYDEYPAFKELIGIENYGIADMEVHGIQIIHGDSGFFSNPINVTRITNPTEVNASAMLMIGNDVNRILEGQGTPGTTLGWLHDRNNQKVVFHWPIVTEHYDLFLGMVICNYFALCDPLVVQTSNPEKNNVITFDPLSRKIQYGGKKEANLSLYSILGAKVLETRIAEQLTLSDELPAGSYIVTLTDNNNSAIESKMIIVF